MIDFQKLIGSASAPKGAPIALEDAYSGHTGAREVQCAVKRRHLASDQAHAAILIFEQL